MAGGLELLVHWIKNKINNLKPWAQKNSSWLILVIISSILLVLIILNPNNAILGVVLGFFLSTGFNEYKKWRRRRQLKMQLNEELFANLHASLQRKSTIESAVVNLENDKILSIESTSFCYEIYDKHYSEISPELNLLDRNSAHIIYEYFRVIDRICSTFDDSMIESLSAGPEQQKLIRQRWLNKLRDLLSLFEILENLIKQHLNGNPADVFRIRKSFEELKTVRFVKP